MMVRMLCMALLLTVAAHAAFRHSKEIRLKKDEIRKIMVQRVGASHLLTFRWTLYKNGGLVVHRSYDGFNAQNVLKLNHKNQSFRIEIDMRGSDPRTFTYILVKFKAFNFESDEAVFDLLLRDDAERVDLKYLNAGMDNSNG